MTKIRAEIAKHPLISNIGISFYAGDNKEPYGYLTLKTAKGIANRLINNVPYYAASVVYTMSKEEIAALHIIAKDILAIPNESN